MEYFLAARFGRVGRVGRVALGYLKAGYQKAGYQRRLIPIPVQVDGLQQGDTGIDSAGIAALPACSRTVACKIGVGVLRRGWVGGRGASGGAYHISRGAILK